MDLGWRGPFLRCLGRQVVLDLPPFVQWPFEVATAQNKGTLRPFSRLNDRCRDPKFIYLFIL